MLRRLAGDIKSLDGNWLVFLQLTYIGLIIVECFFFYADSTIYMALCVSLLNIVFLIALFQQD